MDIILKTDIAGLGFKNDILTVKPGYGRNYLIPQGYAMLATPSNKKVLAENLKQAAHKAENIKKEAEELAAAIGETVVALSTKAGESGKIFGRITNTQVSDFLAEKGFAVDRKKIVLGDIKNVGEYTAVINLHKEVSHEVQVVVTAEVKAD